MSKKKGKSGNSLQIPKGIRYTGKFLETISPKLATLFASKLFLTPIKFKIPSREYSMDRNSIQTTIKIPKLTKSIMVYEYGKSAKKILLVHGWSGRGTQLFKIADALLDHGFATVSFDAPAHGKSEGTRSSLLEFITCIIELEKQFGPFEVAIGHSLGGMSILNALHQNLKIKKAIIIGSGDVIQDIIADFIKKIQLKPQIGGILKEHFEKKQGQLMEHYGSSYVAKSITTPILIIHDTTDEDVNVSAAYAIHNSLENSEIMITEGLAHRKILGDKTVIDKCVAFITR
jgi:pimeloyl-ACP methyl ester carboxylesterase